MAHRVIEQGRRLETRDTHARYYAQNDCPNTTEFGKPEYVDEFGRHYRVAFAHRLDASWVPGMKLPPRPADAPLMRDANGRIKLWMRVPRRKKPTDDFWVSNGTRLRLEPVAPGLPERHVTIRATYRVRPGLRTGPVFVDGWAD